MPLIRWLVAFVFTQLVEMPVYLAAKRRQRVAWPLGERLFAAFGASALTHPVVWFVFPPLLERRGYWSMVASAEVFAVVAEAIYLRLFGMRRTLTFALLANALSAGLGLALRSRWGWP